MSYSSSEAKIVMVDAGSLGLTTELYLSRLEMVLSLMDSGYIGGGSCYGDVHHRFALSRIENRIAEIREKIKRHNQEEGTGV